MDRLIEFIGNNIFWVSLWLAVLILLLWNLFSNMVMGIRQIEPMDLTRRINREDALVVDIRDTAEFEQGHILNAINIPEKEFAERKQELEKYRKRPVVVYCQNGAASSRVVRLLKMDSFPDINALKGGLAMWQRAGLPLSYTTDKA